MSLPKRAVSVAALRSLGGRGFVENAVAFLELPLRWSTSSVVIAWKKCGALVNSLAPAGNYPQLLLVN